VVRGKASTRRQVPGGNVDGLPIGDSRGASRRSVRRAGLDPSGLTGINKGSAPRPDSRRRKTSGLAAAAWRRRRPGTAALYVRLAASAQAGWPSSGRGPAEAGSGVAALTGGPAERPGVDAQQAVPGNRGGRIAPDVRK